jgi:hypothetical protein
MPSTVPTPAVPAVKPEDLDPSNLMTSTTSSLQTVGTSTDTVFATANCFPQLTNQPTFVRRIKCCLTGTIGIKRVNDTGFTPYPCNAGDYIDGFIVAIGGSTSDGSSAGMQFIAEF